MRKLISIVTIAAFMSAYFPALSTSAEGKRPILVVFDFELKTGISPELKEPLSMKLREAIFSTGKFEVVDRNNMNTILQQQGEQAKECYTQECAVEMGRLLTAQKIVTGSVSKIGKSFNISLQVTNLETGLMERIISEYCKSCEPEDLLEFISGLALKIVGDKKEAEAAPAPAAGLLIINSNEKGADVKIDGRPEGTTPLAEPLKLKPGSHTVRVSKHGFTDWQRDIKIDADKKVQVKVSLVAIKTKAAVATSPAAGSEDAALTDQWWFWAGVGGGVLLLGAGAAAAAGGGSKGGGGSGAQTGSVTATW